MSRGNPIRFVVALPVTIPPETKINHSKVKERDDTYRYYDNQLSATLQKVDSLVDQRNETAEDSRRPVSKRRRAKNQAQNIIDYENTYFLYLKWVTLFL